MSVYGPLTEVDTAWEKYLTIKMKINCFRGEMLDITDQMCETPVTRESEDAALEFVRNVAWFRDYTLKSINPLLQDAIGAIKIMFEKGKGEYNVRFFYPFFQVVNKALGALDAMEDTRHELTISSTADKLSEVNGYVYVLARMELEYGRHDFLGHRMMPLALPIYGGAATPFGDIEAVFK